MGPTLTIPFFCCFGQEVDMVNKPIIEIANTLFNDLLDPSRKIMERVWYRNILYCMGEQYLEWIISRATFRRKRRNSKEVPTPTSNIIRDYVRSMRAMILNKKYTIRVWPNSPDIDDREAASLARLVVEDMDLANDEEFEDEKERVADWTVLFGTAFLRVFPEADAGEWYVLKDGEIITTGDVACEAYLPFNVVVDSYGDKLKRKRVVGIKSLKPKEWVEDSFRVKITGTDNPDIVDYQKRLMKMVGDVSPWKGSGLVSAETFDMAAKDLVIYKELEFKPTKKRPEGRYAALVGDQVLYDKNKMPIPVQKGRWEYTLTDFHYHHVAGRFWSDAGVNDQISPQNSINDIDQSLEMNRKGVGRPLVTMPTGMRLKRLNEGGQALMVIEYDSMMSGGQKPDINRGTPLPEQVLNERTMHKQTAQDAGGDPKGVLRGQSPGTRASGVLVDILRETAEQGHSPDVSRFYRSLKRVYRKRLIVKKNVTTENRMLKIPGKGNELKIKLFKGSDLRDNTDVRLELASGVSQTRAGQSQALSEMAKSGVFSDETIPLDVRHELMQRVGLTGIKEKSNIHIEYAERENAVLANTKIDDVIVEALDGKDVNNGSVSYIQGIFTSLVDQETQEEIILGNDPTFKFHDDSIHIEWHEHFILSPEFKTVPPQIQRIAIEHLNSHHKALELKQAKIMEQQMMAQAAQQGGGAAAGGM